MPRRLASLLVAWFAIFSIAAPAITCAAAAQQGDCCPGEGRPPCGECPEKAPAPGNTPSHCLTPPASVSPSGAAQEQTGKIVQPDFEPAAIFPISWVTAPPGASTRSILHRWHPARVDQQSATYLVTGRLRL